MHSKSTAVKRGFIKMLCCRIMKHGFQGQLTFICSESSMRREKNQRLQLSFQK